MALTDSFDLFTNSALTTAFPGLYQLLHQSDLSDNPQDFLLYFGSPISNRKVQTSLNPGVDDIELEVVDRLPHWTAATAYVVGESVQPVLSNGFRYMCIIAGTSHATTEPTWPVTGVGSTIADGTVMWEFVGPRHELTEIKLALTAGGLDTATGGETLSITNTIYSMPAEAVEIHIRVENAVNIVSNNAGTPELGLSFNAITETAEVPT